VAESLGHFVDAVTAVEQAGRQQVPDLVRSDRADPRHCEPAMSAVLVPEPGVLRVFANS
jgi:hypothetical protein